MIKSPVPAPRVLLMGPGGTGKTYSLRTLVDCGVTPCIIALDPGGLPVVGDIPEGKLNWHIIKPPSTSWKDMIEKAKLRQNLTFEAITQEKDFAKNKQTRFIEILEQLANFKDDRTGKEFGPIESWGTNRAIVIDHLTAFGDASKEWTIGSKLVLHQGEWQVAQNNALNLISNIATIAHCWVIMLAHIDRETDLILQTSRIMVHALGRAMAPQLPSKFSDVVLAAREGKEFRWDTAAPNADLKSQNLEIESKIAPSFVSICNKWKSRGGIIETETA